MRLEIYLCSPENSSPGGGCSANGWTDGWREGGGGTCGAQDMGERETVPGRFVFGGWGSVMADICTAHGHLGWFIYPRPPDQASDLPEFVRLEGAPYHTTQFFTFHISSHFQLPVSLYHSARPNPVQADHTQFQQSGKTGRTVAR